MISKVEQLIANANPARRKDLGKSPNGNVIFPGTQLGYSIGEMRDFIKLQKRSKGYKFQTVLNNATDFDLEISGTAKILLGIVADVIAPDTTMYKHTFKLMVNEEQIFSEKNGKFLNPTLNPNKDMEYFPFPRPLSGSDSVILTIESTIAEVVFFDLYYI